MNPQSSSASGSTAPSLRRSLLEAIFMSPAEPRLRAGWRLAVQVILQFVLTLCVGLALFVAWRDLFTSTSGTPNGAQIILTQIGELFAITISVFLARRFLDRRTFRSIGLQGGRGALWDFALGLAITFAMMGLIFFLELALGWLEITGYAWQSQSGPRVLQGTGLFLIICLIVGWNEELMSRGYHLQTLASGLNTAWGWLLSSLVFAVLHLRNPHASGMAVAGIFLAGLLLGYGFIRSGQLWLPMGLHVGWNFFEGVVFGFPVSGLTFYRMIQTTTKGPIAWTGGDFGPEAGMVLIPALAIGFLLTHLYTRGRRAL